MLCRWPRYYFTWLLMRKAPQNSFFSFSVRRSQKLEIEYIQSWLDTWRCRCVFSGVTRIASFSFTLNLRCPNRVFFCVFRMPRALKGAPVCSAKACRGKLVLIFSPATLFHSQFLSIAEKDLFLTKVTAWARALVTYVEKQTNSTSFFFFPFLFWICLFVRMSDFPLRSVC